MKNFFIRKTVIYVSFTMGLYYLIMELYYLYFVGISYSRFGFNVDINPDKYIESKVIFLLMIALSIYVSKVSEFMYSIFIFFIILFLVPALVTYSLSDQIAGPLYSIIVLLIALGTISVQRIRIPAMRSASLSDGVSTTLMMMVVLPIVFTFGIYFNIGNVVLQDIQETRGYFDENSSTLANYVYNWLIKAIVPVLLVFFLIRRQYGYGLISAFILLYLYLISGNKIVYITLFVMLFFFLFGKGYVEKARNVLVALIIALLIIPFIDYYILESHSFKGIFAMRMLFLPAHVNYYYFDFFYDKPLFFAESNLFRLFLTYPYDRPIGFIISETYFNAPDMNSNNGIISDGYMNLGYWGIGLNISIVSGIFLFFNSLDLDSRYLGIFFVMVFLFLSAPMLSMFITSGLWIIFLMTLTIMRKDYLDPMEKRSY